MPEPASTTVMLQNLLDRLAAGDVTARDALVNLASERLMVIARKLLRNFGGEARVEMWTADVLGEAYPRLARALDEVKPTSPVKFFGLARLQMQRVLLDRIRVIGGGSDNSKSLRDTDDSRDENKAPGDNDNSADKRRPRVIPFSQWHSQGNGSSLAREPSGADEERLIDLMLDLVATIESLPDKQADTAWLKLTGLTHREIAEVLGVHHDTVDVYWSNACVKLSKYLAPFMEMP